MDDLRDSLNRWSASGRELPYPRWIEAGVVIGFWVIYFLLRIAWEIVNHAPSGESVLVPIMRWGPFCTLYLVLTFVLFTACRKIRVRDLGGIGAITAHLVLMFVVTVGSEVFIEKSQSALRDLWELSVFESAPTTVKGGIQHLTFIEEVKAYMLLLIAGLARDFFLRYTSKQAQAHALAQRTERLKTRLASARLDALRMQINPHFLFNTLHVINIMAGTNPDGVRRATKRLSGLLRYALNTSDEQEVPLSRELQFLRGYLQIQKLRLQEQLQFTIDVEPGGEGALVPTLLLQPLAENAVKHGVQAIEGMGRIQVAAHQTDRALVLRIEDNGPGLMGSACEEEGVGLENVRNRLSHLYGDRASLDLDGSDLGGCCAEVRIPYHTAEDPQFEAVSVGESASPAHGSLS
jgi:signal transduction histidine kinase